MINEEENFKNYKNLAIACVIQYYTEFEEACRNSDRYKTLYESSMSEVKQTINFFASDRYKLYCDVDADIPLRKMAETCAKFQIELPEDLNIIRYYNIKIEKGKHKIRDKKQKQFDFDVDEYKELVRKAKEYDKLVKKGKIKRGK